MTHKESETYKRLLLIATMPLIFSGWLGWRVLPVAAASGQSLGTKFVDVDALVTRFDPVTITKVTVGGQEIQAGRSSGPREDAPGTPFQADQDWLKNMSIFIKNRTDKVIVFAQVQLVFPESGDGTDARPATVFTISVGQRPEWSRYVFDGTREELEQLDPRKPIDATKMKLMPVDPTRKPLSLAPGGTMEIQVADYVAKIQSHIEQSLAFAQLTRVDVERRTFYFENGMRWDVGTYALPLANHPGYYKNLASDYFPGNAFQYPTRE